VETSFQISIEKHPFFDSKVGLCRNPATLRALRKIGPKIRPQTRTPKKGNVLVLFLVLKNHPTRPNIPKTDLCGNSGDGKSKK